MQITVEKALDKLVDLNGFIGAAIVDAQTGAIFSMQQNPTHSEFPIEQSALADAKAMNEKVKSIQALGLGNALENIQIVLTHQYHLICPLPNINSIFIYCVLERPQANLLQARELMASIAQRLNAQYIQI